MAKELITYPAQKLAIKSMRGSNFRLVLNIKNSDGSDYNLVNSDGGIAGITEDKAYIRIFKSNGYPLQNSPSDIESPDENVENFQTGNRVDEILSNSVEIEDGKITFDWSVSVGGYSDELTYSPFPGRYKYTIFTINWSTTSIVSGTVAGGDAIFLEQANTILFYGDFIVEDNNSYNAFSDVASSGYLE